MKRGYNIIGDRLKNLIYEKCEENSSGEVAMLLQMTLSHVNYWLTKKEDPNYHNNIWGKHENRTRVFSKTGLPLVFQSFKEYINQNQTSGVREITQFFKERWQREVSKSTTKRLLKSWNWTWKVPTYVQLNKYTESNLTYYGYYLLFLKRIDSSRLKFVDESHFVPRALRKKKVVGMRNQRVWIQVKDLHGKHSSMTLLTSLVHEIPVYFNWRVQSNTGKDFLLFIGSCIVNGYLSDGDFLIVDNASVHRDEENLPTLIELLDVLELPLFIFQPTAQNLIHAS